MHQIIPITDLLPDSKNHNKGTKKGKEAITASFDRFGAGRSVLLDKHNQLIAGNKATAQAIEQGIQQVIVVETTGNQLVAVKRMDVDLDSKQGREMAIADNAVAVASIEFDQSVLLELDDQYGGLDLDDFYIEIDGSSQQQDYEFTDVSQLESLSKVAENPKTEVRDARGVLVPNPDKEKEASIFPISLLLARNELNIWKKFKEEAGERSDTKAFTLLLQFYHDHTSNAQDT